MGGYNPLRCIRIGSWEACSSSPTCRTRPPPRRWRECWSTQRVAACVNVLAPCRSVYRWQNAVETAVEVPLLIKTSAERYADLEAAIRAGHPYELPEIIAVPIERGLPDYLAWVAAETAFGPATA